MRSIFDIILFRDRVNHDGSFEHNAEIFYRLWLGQNCEIRIQKNSEKNDKIRKFRKIRFFQFFSQFY